MTSTAQPFVIAATEMQEGAGANVRRLFPTARLRHFDPFVVIDEFRVQPPAGFPEHPHRGFEAITYMLDGAFHHRDNLGNDSVVPAGGAQRFTAGSGLVHSEMPAGEGVAHGIQLWINLPQALKQTAPHYEATQPEDVPESTADGVTVRQLVGPNAPVQLKTEVDYRDIRLDGDCEIDLGLVQGLRGFVYVLSGTVHVDDDTVETGHARFSDQPAVRIKAQQPARVLSVFGRPHNEPIRQWGPYVD